MTPASLDDTDHDDDNDTEVVAAAPRRSGRPRGSFRFQLATAMAGLSVLLAVLLSLAMVLMLSRRSESNESAALRTVASNSARTLSEGLTFRQRQVETLASSPSLWSDGLESERVQYAIGRSQVLDAHTAWIGVADAAGVVKAATGRLLVGANVGERPWFTAGKTGAYVGDVHPAKLLAKLLPTSADGSPQRFIDFSAPIVRNGTLVGVVGLHGSWEWTRSVIESLLPEDAARRQIEAFVFDRSGHLVWAPTRSSVSAGQTLASLGPPSRERSAAMTHWQDSPDRFLTAFVSVPSSSALTDLGWTVVVREPEAKALAVAREGALQVLGLGCVAAVLSCSIAWLMANRLARPLRLIATAANQIEAGDPRARIPSLASNREVAALSAALSSMTARLLASNSDLEARVLERTAALEVANAALDRLANKDALTDLDNRRGFETFYERAIASATRRGAPLSVLLLDIDHFKRVNDRFGHDVGDAVLRHIARVLQARLRSRDILARIGGEEFIAVLGDTGAGDARCVAQSLVDAVACAPIEPVGTVTISCGVAQLRLGLDDGASLLQRADQALYRAKNSGRNRRSFLNTGLELSYEMAPEGTSG